MRVIRKSGDLTLTADDLKVAEERCWKAVQLEHCANEIHFLENNKPVPKSSELYGLNPYLDELGRIRLRTRLPEDPIVLDGNNRMVYLMIMKLHEDNFHQGLETVLAKIKENFYIPGLRSVVKKIFKSCQIRKNRKAKPNVPMMAPLPACRLDAGARASNVRNVIPYTRSS